MAERTDPHHLEGGVRLTRAVLESLPPLSHQDEATAAIIEGMLTATEVLEQDEISTTKP